MAQLRRLVPRTSRVVGLAEKLFPSAERAGLREERVHRATVYVPAVS